MKPITQQEYLSILSDLSKLPCSFKLHWRHFVWQKFNGFPAEYFTVVEHTTKETDVGRAEELSGKDLEHYCVQIPTRKTAIPACGCCPAAQHYGMWIFPMCAALTGIMPYPLPIITPWCCGISCRFLTKGGKSSPSGIRAKFAICPWMTPAVEPEPRNSS